MFRFLKFSRQLASQLIYSIQIITQINKEKYLIYEIINSAWWLESSSDWNIPLFFQFPPAEGKIICTHHLIKIFTWTHAVHLHFLLSSGDFIHIKAAATVKFSLQNL